VTAGQRRYPDPFYFDEDTTWQSEDAVIFAGAALFADLPVPWRSGTRHGCISGTRSASASRCCFGVTVDADGSLRVNAPHGYTDLFEMVVRPNRKLAPRRVYEAETARWAAPWPELTVLPWEEPTPS
jgi:hypothetical protein